MGLDGERIRVDGLADFHREEFVRDGGADRAELFVRSKNRIPLRCTTCAVSS